MMKCLLPTALAFISDAAVLKFEAHHSNFLSSSAFDDYIAKFNRSYQANSEEYSLRKKIFEQRLAQIKAHNANPAKLWTAGLNSLTDLTDNEFAQRRGWRRSHTRAHHSLMQRETSNTTLTPVMLEQLAPDWTNLIMASQVPDQGGCGSCWAVASMSLLQGRYESQLKKHRTFSVQELVNCVDNPRECGGKGGCDGATVELAMDYVAKKGLEEEHTIPYEATQGKCSASSFVDVTSEAKITRRGRTNDFKLAHWETLPENEAAPLMRAVVEGPVAVSVSADAWMMYEKGIFDGCGKDSVINHAVTLFGYGKTDRAKYWHIRNSWGSSWGENGFIRLLRKDTATEEENWCGTDNNPGQGVACKPYPDKVTICGMCGVLYDSVAVHFEDSSHSHNEQGSQAEKRKDGMTIGPIAMRVHSE